MRPPPCPLAALTLVALVALAACGGAAVPSQPPRPPAQPQPGDLVITDVTVVPMDRDGALPHQTVVVRGDRIVAVAPAASVTVPAGATRVDGAGKWLMPGLADMHVHTWFEPELTLFVAAGVTTVRNMYGSEQHLAWRNEIAAGQRLGPTIVTASPIIDGDPPVWPGSIVLTNPADADRIVAGVKAKGYDFLKPYSRLSREAYDALVAAGRRHGLALAGHTPGAVGLHHVLASRQATIEHLDGWLLALVPEAARAPGDAASSKLPEVLGKLDERRLPGLVEQTIAAGAWNCPTLIVLDRMAALDDVAALRGRVRWLSRMAPQIVAAWDPKADFRTRDRTPADYAAMRRGNEVRGRIVAALARANARLLVGTDAGNPFVIPGESLHDELELLIAAGVPRAQALRAATAGAAEYLGQRGRLGVVAEGARADLLLVDVDPLAAPLPLVPAGVVLRGAWLPRAELEDKLAAIERTYAAPASAAFEHLPPLVAQGAQPEQLHYEIVQGTTKIGEERLVASTLPDGRAISAQVVGDFPIHVEMQYTIEPAATALSVKANGGTIALTGKVADGTLTVSGTDARGGRVALSAPKPVTVIFAGAGIGGSFILAQRLAGMKVGESRTVPSLELAYFPKPSIDAATHEVERKPDAGGHRVFSITTRTGPMAIASELVIDERDRVVSHAFGAPLGVTYRRK